MQMLEKKVYGIVSRGNISLQDSSAMKMYQIINQDSGVQRNLGTMLLMCIVRNNTQVSREKATTKRTYTGESGSALPQIHEQAAALPWNAH